MIAIYQCKKSSVANVALTIKQMTESSIRIPCLLYLQLGKSVVKNCNIQTDFGLKQKLVPKKVELVQANQRCV